MSNSSIWPIDRTLSGTTILDQSRPGSDGNKEVLSILQSSSISGASPSNCLVLYPGHSLGESYPIAEMQSVYSTAPASLQSCFLTHAYVCVCVRERERESVWVCEQNTSLFILDLIYNLTGLNFCILFMSEYWWAYLIILLWVKYYFSHNPCYNYSLAMCSYRCNAIHLVSHQAANDLQCVC